MQLSPPDGATRRTITELLDAVAALPELFLLELQQSTIQDTAAAGHAFGELLRANLPNLRILCVNLCQLGDEGVAPLLDGLAVNMHLRELHCHDNNLSEAFERDRRVPAMAALATRPALW